MSNIYDIAKRTGYSASTVARALSGRGYCSEKAKTAVQEAAQEMNYVPVQAAKILKSKRTKKVMFCIPDLFNPFYFAMIEGVNKVMERFGYYTILVHSEHSKRKELEMVEALNERFVDGLIMVSFDFDEPLTKAMAAAPVPVVTTNPYEADSPEQGFDCAFVDHIKATYIATMHLVENGHKKIVFLGGSNAEQTGKERLQGYVKAMQDCGMQVDERLILQSDFTRRGGREKVAAFIESKLPFDGVIACNDLMGIGCINACNDAGIAIPQDVSLVSLDNTDYCSCAFPRLTSVDMRQYQIGANAAELLMERIREERDYVKTIRLEPMLVQRNSVQAR